MDQAIQIYFPLNHWSALQELLKSANAQTLLIVASREQKEFIKEIASHLMVLTSKEALLSKSLAMEHVALWPFEFLEDSEIYYQLAEEKKLLWLISWSWRSEEFERWHSSIKKSQNEILMVETKQWLPQWGAFWGYWNQKWWMRKLAWGDQSSIVMADDKDARELKMYFRAEGIHLAKRHYSKPKDWRWRVPAYGEKVYFTHKASQTIEFRYFQGFQQRPQRSVYLLQYLKLWGEKLMAPLRLI